MPEVTLGPSQEKQPTKPQVQPEKAKKVSSKKIVIIVVAVAAVLAVLGGLLWFFVLDKSKDASEQTKVSTPSAKEATPSAKEATPSAEEETGSVDPTSGWKTFTSESIGYSLKVPQSWKTKEGADDPLCGTGVDFLAPTKDLLGLCATEFGGMVVVQKIDKSFTAYTNNINMSSLKDSQKINTTVDGEKAVKVTGIYNMTEDFYSLNGSEVIF